MLRAQAVAAERDCRVSPPPDRLAALKALIGRLLKPLSQAGGLRMQGGVNGTVAVLRGWTAVGRPV